MYHCKYCGTSVMNNDVCKRCRDKLLLVKEIRGIGKQMIEDFVQEIETAIDTGESIPNETMALYERLTNRKVMQE